jgi:hypothetical protein
MRLCDNDTKQKLDELVLKLFPGSAMREVADCLLKYKADTAFDCAKFCQDWPERMHLFIELANLLSKIDGENKLYTTENLGRPDFDNPCDAYVYGLDPEGDCQTDGHFLCGTCSCRSPDTTKNPESPWYVRPMERRKGSSEW